MALNNKSNSSSKSRKFFNKRIVRNLIIFSSLSVVAVSVVLLSVFLLKKKAEIPTDNTDDTFIPTNFIGTWSYYNKNFNDPWVADDWFYTDTDGKTKLWQNFMLTDGYESWDYYGKVWTEIYNRTGVKLLVFWRPSTTGSFGITSTIALEAFDQNYKQLVGKYTNLPTEPSGVILYDEPKPLFIVGDNVTWGIVTASQQLRQKYPKAKLYCNFLYTTMTNVSNCQLMGQSELDYISSDEYFDYNAGTYSNTYRTNLYPNLKPTQKVFILPYAAYKEASPGTIVPTTADTYCYSGMPASALNYKAWYDLDSQWISGYVIYRLKNLWWDNTTGANILTNPSSTGIGLVDRVSPGGDYIMPNTVGFWHTVGGTFCDGIYDKTK
jgi:hypothetical protein